MIKFKKIVFVVSGLLLFLFVFTNFNVTGASAINPNEGVLAAGSIIQSPDNLPQVDASEDKLKTVLQIVFGIIGAIAVLIITIAGFSYIISGGDPQKTAKAKDTILYALIGLVIAIFSFTIVGFILNKL